LDDNTRKQADDLLALLVGQSRVEAGPDLGEEVVDHLGHDLGLGSLYGGHTSF
jgi:hypothetical protein